MSLGSHLKSLGVLVNMDLAESRRLRLPGDLIIPGDLVITPEPGFLPFISDPQGLWLGGVCAFTGASSAPSTHSQGWNSIERSKRNEVILKFV